MGCGCKNKNNGQQAQPVQTQQQQNNESVKNAVKKIVEKPARLGRIEVKEIAFGLRGLDVTIAVPDVEGGLDPIVEKFGKIKKVENVEVVDIGRI